MVNNMNNYLVNEVEAVNEPQLSEGVTEICRKEVIVSKRNFDFMPRMDHGSYLPEDLWKDI